ncbi:MAG: hypothetical protein AB8B85_07370 [Paracoccaceae bacterium]
MQWFTHLVLAEAVRRGASLCCEHPDLVPFAADLAGPDCHSALDTWRIASSAGGYRCVSHLPSVNEISADAIIIATGNVPAVRPAIWCDAPVSADLSGMAPLEPGFLKLHLNTRRLGSLAHDLQDFANGLISGVIDPWDWMGQHLVGQSRVRELSWERPGLAAFQIDPLSARILQGRSDAYRLVRAGGVRLVREGPLRLRLPMFGTSGAAAEVRIRAPATLRTKAYGTTGSVQLTHLRDKEDHLIVVTPAVAVPYVDVAFSAPFGDVAGITLLLPDGRPNEASFPDTLDQYGDPLDLYAEIETP